VPRKYEYSLPKKMILGALRSALSAKFAQQKLTVVDGWTLESHKTKAFREALSKLDGETRTILLVENGANVNLERASRNLEGVMLVPTRALGAYDLLRHDHLMLSREAAAQLSRALSAAKSGEVPAGGELVPAAPAKVAAKPSPKPKAAKKRVAAKKKTSKAKPKPKAKKD
jgi:ribosomal protein L4